MLGRMQPFSVRGWKRGVPPVHAAAGLSDSSEGMRGSASRRVVRWACQSPVISATSNGYWQLKSEKLLKMDEAAEGRQQGIGLTRGLTPMSPIGKKIS
jgi:hypothetical protein